MAAHLRGRTVKLRRFALAFLSTMTVALCGCSVAGSSDHDAGGQAATRAEAKGASLQSANICIDAGIQYSPGGVTSRCIYWTTRCAQAKCKRCQNDGTWSGEYSC